jgi:hypothetical protein
LALSSPSETLKDCVYMRHSCAAKQAALTEV